MSAFPDIFPSKTIDKAFQNFLGWFPVPLNWKVLHDLSKWLLKTFPSKPLSKPLSWVNLPVMAFWTEWWTSSKSNMCTISHSRNLKKHSNLIGQHGTNHTYVHRFVQLYFTHAHKPIVHATMFCFAFLGFSTLQTAVKERDFLFPWEMMRVLTWAPPLWCLRLPHKSSTMLRFVQGVHKGRIKYMSW